ncbi:MAG: hypothetical protein WAW73_06355 [Rhodoferax sp.]
MSDIGGKSGLSHYLFDDLSDALNVCKVTPGEFDLLVKSADAGGTHAMYKLGMMYRTGKSFRTLLVPKDAEKSHQYLCSAAEQGHALAAWRIGSRKDFPLLQAVLFGARALKEFVAHLLVAFLTGIADIARISLKSAAWLIGVSVAFGLVWLIYSGIASLPVSVAILLGAVLIAAAVNK